MSEYDPALSNGDLGRIEYRLKKHLSKLLISLQDTRANNLDGFNSSTARKYVEHARTLRRVLKKRGRQKYVPVSEIHAQTDHLTDDRIELAGIDHTATTIDACHLIHDAGAIGPDRTETHTRSDNVPGRP